MRAERLSESAIILRELGAPAFAVAQAASRAGIPGLIEAVPAFETVGLFYDGPPNLSETISRLQSIQIPDIVGKSHVIPVRYDGPDLYDSASALALEPSELVRLHQSGMYTCLAIGFSPGFPYLGGLPERISGLPRRESPRPRVDSGSVGIVGTQSCVYPSATPGGWRLIGTTPVCIVDIDSEYFPIKVGDRIRFEAIDEAMFDRLRGSRL